MRYFLGVFFLVFVSLMTAYPQTAEQFAALWDDEHISKILPSDTRHADLKKYLDQLRKMGLKIDQVGLSNANREIYQIEWGKGPLKVFMWSQMHGDEPTATPALIDMFAFLQKHRDKDWVKKIGETITIRGVPMLNPDGAELYQRRNLQGIDINRDAVDLKTPEGRLLKQLRDEWSPAIGFNLHNQQELTTVGSTPKQAAISFLVVFGDEAKTMNPGHERNQRLTSAMIAALNKFIPGHIARYADDWTPTAFGDNFSAWGTPAILIESGGLYGKDEMYLVKMNFVAYLTALNALATGSEKTQDPNLYINLPENGSGGLIHFVFRGANLVDTSVTPVAISPRDISAFSERRRASFLRSIKIRAIGAQLPVKGFQEFDLSGFNVMQRFGKAKAGELADLLVYKRERNIDWTSTEIEKQFPPDAIFSAGKWIKGENLIPKR